MFICPHCQVIPSFPFFKIYILYILARIPSKMSNAESLFHSCHSKLHGSFGSVLFHKKLHPKLEILCIGLFILQSSGGTFPLCYPTRDLILSGTLPHNIIPASPPCSSLTNHLLFQRSYDWNYNLNRHLKYECGKENAFMCSKCGRRFPHKQNCVYHLKRKHKIVCETIDQYVSAGLVVFQGASVGAGTNETSPSGEQQLSNNVNNLKESSVTPPPSQLGSSQSTA